MKNLIILLILFSSFSFSQTATTKFILNGYLIENPEITNSPKTPNSLSKDSKHKCKFKKNKEISFLFA